MVFVLLAGLWVTAPAQAAGSFRLLFRSDWSGTSEVYAADPSGASPTAEVTLGFSPSCGPAGCNYDDAYFGRAVPSRDGKLIAYTRWGSCDSSHLAWLTVARADGTHAHAIARSRSISGCAEGFTVSWAPNSKRLAYAVTEKIHTVDLDGRRNSVVGHGDRVSWSPDGRSIAFLDLPENDPYPQSQEGSLGVRRNGRTRYVAGAASSFEWSPSGRWLAYGQQGAVDVARADGSGTRQLSNAHLLNPRWSADGRFLSVKSPDGPAVLRVADGTLRILDAAAGVYEKAEPIWRPKGHALAVVGKDGTFLVDAKTGAARLLAHDQAFEDAWAPDGSYLAYTRMRLVGHYSLIELHVATFAGESRMLVRSGDSYGGDISSLAWTRVPKNAHYQAPESRVVAAVRDDGLTAPWPITRLAADGNRVAYVSCGHVFVWTPATQTVVQAEPSSYMGRWCPASGEPLLYWIYDLALSGDRVAYAHASGGMGKTCVLEGMRINDPTTFFGDGLDCGSVSCDEGSGNLLGGGGLLVFSLWGRGTTTCPRPPSPDQIRRLDYRPETGWSDVLIATSPGPLVPFDVDAGRIVAGGENATVIFDGSGGQLLSVPVSPLAAQLSARELVILVRGELLVHDASTGARLHAWPLPDVPSGAECGAWYAGSWECRGTELVLEDAARALAAYLFKGEVHVLDLDDGADSTIGKGQLARFTDTGLVYVDGANIQLVPFGRLSR